MVQPVVVPGRVAFGNRPHACAFVRPDHTRNQTGRICHWLLRPNFSTNGFSQSDNAMSSFAIALTRIEHEGSTIIIDKR